MEQEENTESNSSIIIPKIFFSDLTGAPINHCIACEKELLIDATPYLIEKALKTYDGYQSFSTVFEYAICLPCAQQMKGNISAKSMANMMKYFQENVNVDARQSLLSAGTLDESLWLEHCLVRGTHVSEVHECQIYAYCEGEKLVFGEFPYMVSGKALDEVVDLLSQETLEDLDRLKDELIDTPSEFQDLLQSGPKVFI
jgi:hypothetical protein